MGRSPLTERSMVSFTPLHVSVSSTPEGFFRTSSSSNNKDGSGASSVATADTVIIIDPVEVFSDSDDELLRDDSDKEHQQVQSQQQHCPLRRYYSPQQEVRKSPMHHHHQHQQQSQSSGQNHHRRCKSVGFADIEIRTYPVVMGDHPCCSMGCPLALGWEYSENQPVSVDDYEAHRSPRRARGCLKTSWDQRRSMLKEVGVSDGEVKRAERKLHRERSCQRKTQSKICANFFSNVDCVPPPPPPLPDLEASMERRST